MLLGALEAGGTKMVCAIGDETGNIIDRISIPTNSPDITMPQLIAYFKQFSIEALGIGTFGPADLNPASKTYGHILTTPKLAWANYDIRGVLADALQVPVGFDTDVNASAIGEASYGCLKGIANGIYITIGTGIGIGVIVNHKPLHGMLHPEGGHILLDKNPSDTFSGSCPFHPNCLEGLAAGPAIEKRYGKKAIELANIPEVWELEAEYIAKALVNYILVLSPERIVLGGGVMHQEQLFPMIRQKTKQFLNGYVTTKQLEDLETYIVPPSLNDNQGVLGCFRLALDEKNTIQAH